MASHIPSTSYTPSFEHQFADQASSAQSTEAPRERRTLHQMEQELTEWAKYPALGEDRIATKEKILVAYQNTPDLLELENIGLTDKRLNLPKCLEDLDCQIKCIILKKNGILTPEVTITGKWQYIPETNSMNLSEGTLQIQNSTIRAGTFKYIHELEDVHITDGTVKDKTGQISTGKWQYIPKLESMHITEGSVQFKNGDIHTGTWQYIPELKGMYLTDGSSQQKNSQILTGKRQYIPEFGDMHITEGSFQFKNGDIYTGTHQYIPELKSMGMDGTIHYNNGRLEEGKFKKINLIFMGYKLLDGIVTQPDGTREQRTHGKYSNLKMKMVYESKTPLPPVAPPGKPAKLVVPLPSTPTEASTSTQPTQAHPPVVDAANSETVSKYFHRSLARVSRTMAIRIIFSEVAVKISTSFASRLKPPSQANVRSTIHRIGSTAKTSLIFVEMFNFSFNSSSTNFTEVPR